MSTALIAEDEPFLALALKAELAALWPELQITATVGDGASAVAQALARPPEVCFFDIRMPGMSGLEAAQALAEDWPESGAPFPLIVFVTAYDQYALQAFQAQAVDYIVKPVASAHLAACVARLKARLAERAPQGNALARSVEQLRALLTPLAGPTASPSPRLAVVQAQVGATVHMVPIDRVIYFEAADKYVRVITADREHLIRSSLKDLLPQLDPSVFWQVHRGTVVRADAIASALREESGKVQLSLHGRAEKLSASRLYAHLFRGM
ncbi:MAG: LytTR family DNA-binding domain-containing protein [Pseudomonadota bacterium]